MYVDNGIPYYYGDRITVCMYVCMDTKNDHLRGDDNRGQGSFVESSVSDGFDPPGIVDHSRLGHTDMKLRNINCTE